MDNSTIVEIRTLKNYVERSMERYDRNLTSEYYKKLVEVFYMKFDVKTNPTTEQIKTITKPIFDKYSIKAGLFGSYVKGTQNQFSDIDFVILEKPSIFDLFDLMRVRGELEDALGKFVDLITYTTLYENIKNNIDKELILIE